jgi:3-deoxy-D-manno-octulosonic-acid transferase
LSLFLYNLFLLLYSGGIRLAALWNPKARLWVNGRKNWKLAVSGLKPLASSPQSAVQSHESGPGPQLTPHNSQAAPHQSPLIWMHCASLGEFEQGRPLLEAAREQYPGYKILLTFFSPSGYEIRKNYTGADLVLYLPMDDPNNAREFIDTIKPSLVLWVKYEYWYYYLIELKKRNIPVLLISGIFRKDQPFFKWYGGLWKKILENFDHLFVQTKSSGELLNRIGVMGNITVTGDTRFDRVITIAEQWEKLAEPIEQFCEGHQIIVAGSTWEEDEEELIHYAKAYPRVRFIFVPHEVSKARIQDLQQEFPEALLYSSLINRQLSTVIHTNVLIIDTIGILSRLYKYATIAYVGGGFNESGIHNILEAAVYGKPVIFGPEYEKFAEATGLVDAGAAFSIENALELEALLNRLLNNDEEWKKSSKVAREYVYGHKGATALIMDYIHRKRLLIN